MRRIVCPESAFLKGEAMLNFRAIIVSAVIAIISVIVAPVLGMLGTAVVLPFGVAVFVVCSIVFTIRFDLISELFEQDSDKADDADAREEK